jgi:thioester reductase-like protein
MGGMGVALKSVWLDCTLILPTPGTLLNTESFASMIKHSKSTSAFTPPSLLESMLEYPHGMEVLSKLSHIAYVGGPLNPHRGEKLSKVLAHLYPFLGSTEGGPAHLIQPQSSSLWNAMKFIGVGQRMEEVAPGFFELVFPRTELIERTYAYFHSYAELKTEYRTKDLFSPIEGHDGWWTFRGRADNWIAMSNGFKMDPTEMENIITAHPDVSGALVAGSHRFRLCLLIEVKTERIPINDASRADMLERIWPSIDEANKTAPKFGRVPKELVLFATEEKPFLRASKGTIQRQLTIMAYDAEIDNTYGNAENGLLTLGVPPLKSTEPWDLMAVLQDLYRQSLDMESIGVDDDLFTLGLDSLAVYTVLARLKTVLRNYGVNGTQLEKVDTKLLYAASTVARLADQLSMIASETSCLSASTSSIGQDDMSDLLMKYDAEVRDLAASIPMQNEQAIVLTGSTGSLGSYILSALLARTDVKKVICLSRSADAKLKQSASFQAKGLPPLPATEDRVVFLQADLAKPKIGLSDEDYTFLTREATTIIHNAFPVNFLMTVRSFEPQIQAMINLLGLAQHGTQKPTFLFVSSIAAATPATGNRQVIAEAVLSPDQGKDLYQQGYAQAKFICERLVDKYSTESGRKAAILRVGQISGPLSGTGSWNVQEWVPSLVLSSKHLGVAPESPGQIINWIPVDELGKIISELVDDATKHLNKGALVYNVVNPSPTTWTELLPALKTVAPTTVPASEWIVRLEESKDTGTHMLDRNPGVKLIDFYKAMFGDDRAVKIDVGNLLRGSETATRLSPTRLEHMKQWMQAWHL